MKKLIFGALASVLFATTGFAKSGETLVYENLNVITENQIVNKEAPEDTYVCRVVITIYDKEGREIDHIVATRTIEAWSDSSALTTCEFEGTKLLNDLKNLK